MAGRKQFDVEAALDAAMIQFWSRGYAETSIDDLTRATGLNRSSLYSSFGDKNSLFVCCLQRYVARYGERFDEALANADAPPLDAARSFFAVTMDRIADPDVPDGCLVVQSAMAIPVLTPKAVERVHEAVNIQLTRVRAALRRAGLPETAADELAVHITAVNHSLAVMSRAGANESQLHSIVNVTLDALATALAA